jgi:hypothetical protein
MKLLRGAEAPLFHIAAPISKFPAALDGIEEKNV